MTALLFLFAPISPAQQPPQAIAAEIAPMPAAIPDSRQLAEWVAMLAEKNYERQQIAYTGLMRAGLKAKDMVPDLIKLLASKDSQVRMDQAIDVLGEIGPDAKPAVPQLLALLRPGFGGYLNDRIAIALAKIDRPHIEATRALLLSSGKCQPIILATSSYLAQYPAPVVAHLVDMCRDKDAVVREKAVLVLGGMANLFGNREGNNTLVMLAGSSGKGVPAALEKLLGDEVPKVRLTAAIAIAHIAPELAEKTIPIVLAIASDDKLASEIGTVNSQHIFMPVPEKAAKALLPLFDQPKDSLRWWAISTLSGLPVQSQLETVLKEGKSPRAREAAAICLGCRYENAASVPALKAALGDSEFIVRFAAAQGLVNLNAPESKSAFASTVPVLIEGLKHDTEQVRHEASQCLLRIGTPAKAAIPELKRLLADANKSVALSAALTLVSLDPASSADAIPALTAGLSGSNGEVIRAANALAPMGATAKDAIPQLLKNFDGKAPQVRLAVAEAAARIDATQGEKAVAVLLDLLKNGKGNALKHNAVEAIVRIGPNAKPAMPALLEMFQSNHKAAEDFRVELSLAMVSIDPENAKPALTWIGERFAKPGDGDAYELADRMPTLGARAKPLIPVLLAMLESKPAHYRETAVETLGAIGPDATDALPRLKEISAKDPRPATRKLALEAIKKIEGK